MDAPCPFSLRLWFASHSSRSNNHRGTPRRLPRSKLLQMQTRLDSKRNTPPARPKEPTRYFFTAFLAWATAQTRKSPTESAIAIKKHSPIDDFPSARSKIPASIGCVYLLLTISAYDWAGWTATHRTPIARSADWPCGFGAPLPISARKLPCKRSFAIGVRWCSTFRRKSPWKAPHRLLAAAEEAD